MAKPFNDLFDGFEDFKDPEPTLAGTIEPAQSAAAPAAVPAGENKLPLEVEDLFETLAPVEQLCQELAEARRRISEFSPRITQEMRTLRDENDRLQAENKKWKSLAKEYKQILSQG